MRPQRQILADMVDALPPGARVLNAGCGEGKTLRLVLSRRPDLQCYGVDFSDVGALLPSGVSFTQGSVEELDTLYAENFFDAVICQHVIEHLIQPLALMRGISAVLKPGGVLFVETPNWTRIFVPFSTLFFWNDYTHVHVFTPFSMRRLLIEHRFAPSLVKTVSSFQWFGNRKPEAPEADRDGFPPPSAFAAAHERRSLAARVLSKLVDPLLRDTLIAVAENHKEESVPHSR